MRFLVFFLLTSTNVLVFSQSNETEPYGVAESSEEIPTCSKFPQFPGGDSLLAPFIAKHLVYPQGSMERNESAKIYVEVLIDANGNILETKLVKASPYPELNQAALNVLAKLPKWEPGYACNEGYVMRVVIPISFKLQ